MTRSPRNAAGVLTLTLVALAGCAADPGSGEGPGTATSSPARSGSAQPGPATPSPAAPSSAAPSPPPDTSPPRDLATGLDVPWEVARLPDGRMLITERETAAIKVRAPSGEVTELGTVPGVRANGEGGLLGLAPSPDFAADRTVFVYYSTRGDNRVARIALDGDRLGRPEVILDGIPTAGNHNGGRIAFGPDRLLYVATGDASDSGNAQDRDSLAGKILRIAPDGSVPAGNPFGTPVWSLGHRNVQGLAWASDGTLYASEFGQKTYDELNVITPGANYGWPEVEGAGHRPGLTDPIAQWGTDESSPSGITVDAGGDVWLAALKGERVWRVRIGPDHTATSSESLLRDTYGRVRQVVATEDGRLLVLTNNTSRGTPREGDDRLVSIPLPAR